MVLTFHGDESYDQRGFVFAGLLGTQDEWERLERQWVKRLEFERRNGRPLSRYHANNCEAGQGEYLEWGGGERTCHVKKLVALIRRRGLAVVAAGIDLGALVEVFPADKRDPIAAAYDLTVRQAMIMMARGIKKSLRPDTSITMIYDRSRYSGVVQRAFEKLTHDPRWPHGDLFATCAPMSWMDCVPLQPADMVAFDTRRMLYARLKYNSYTMRRSLRELLGHGKPIMARYFDKTTLQLLKSLHRQYRHEEGVYAEDEQGNGTVQQNDRKTLDGSA